MKDKKLKTIEIILVIAIILFFIMVGVLYKNLAVLSDSMSTTTTEVTTEIAGE